MAFLNNSPPRQLRHRMLIIVLVGILVIGGAFAARAKITSLSSSEMSRVTGREGLFADIEFPNGIEMKNVNYNDPDGDGTAGTLSFDPICLETGGVDYTCGSGTVDLTGTTLDLTDDATLNGSQHGALVINPASAPSDLDLRIGAIHLGDPGAGSPVVEDVFLNNIDWHNPELRIGTNSNEGILADIDLKLDIERFELADNNGFGSSGTYAEFAVRSISFHDGSNYPVTFAGLRVDASSDVTIGGTSRGGLVVRIPDGTFTLETGSVTTNHCCSDNIVNSTRFSDVSFAGSSLEVGAKP